MGEGKRSLRQRVVAALAARPARIIPDGACDLRAAVTLVLRPAGGESAAEGNAAGAPRAETLFVRRALLPGDPWGGHTALPGGRAAPEDADLLETARRELREETGLALERGAFLGRLDDVRPASPGLPPVAIAPFVAWTPGAVRVRENRELAGHTWIPLAHLLDPGRRVVHRLPERPGHEWPAITHGESVIWGLTFQIVEDFLGRLDPSR